MDAWDTNSVGFGRWWNAISGKTDANNFSAEQAQIDRDFNASEADKNRQWQEMMSNTAYTRAVADMKNAGINPASLSGTASTGGGASTPSGSSASSSSAAGGASGAGPFGILGTLIGTVASIALGHSARAAKLAQSATMASSRVEAARLAASSRVQAARIYKGLLY